jgi:hypothetical protein
MAAKPRPKPKRKTTDKQKQQSERFKETARKLEVELSSDKFQLVMDKLLPRKKRAPIK